MKNWDEGVYYKLWWKRSKRRAINDTLLKRWSSGLRIFCFWETHLHVCNFTELSFVIFLPRQTVSPLFTRCHNSIALRHHPPCREEQYTFISPHPFKTPSLTKASPNPFLIGGLTITSTTSFLFPFLSHPPPGASLNTSPQIGVAVRSLMRSRCLPIGASSLESSPL